MKTKSYSLLFCRILLWMSRIQANTFGGITLSASNSLESQKSFIINKNKFLKWFGNVGFLLSLLWCSFQLFEELNSTSLNPKGLIVDIISSVPIFLTAIERVVILFISIKFGDVIFDFFSCYSLSWRQFQVCFSTFLIPMLGDTVVQAVSQIRAATRIQSLDSTSNQIRKVIRNLFTEYLLVSISINVALSLRLSMSLVAFWRIRDLKNQLFFDNVQHVTEEFLNLRKTFNSLQNICFPFNLMLFVSDVSYLLGDVPILIQDLNSNNSFHQFFNDLVWIIAICKIYGMPHEASKELVEKLDDIAVKMPKGSGLMYGNMVMSRDTVGFRLLGVKYGTALLPSVFVFVLSYAVLIVQTTQN